MQKCVRCCDALLRVDTQHLLHYIVKLCISWPDDLLQCLTMSHMPRLRRWEAGGILQRCSSEIRRLLRHHLGRNIATDVLHQTEVFISVVHREEQIRSVQLEQHATDAPQICRETPAILEQHLWSPVLSRLHE